MPLICAIEWLRCLIKYKVLIFREAAVCHWTCMLGVCDLCSNSGRHSFGVSSDAVWTLQRSLRPRSYRTCWVPACTLALSPARRCYRHRQVDMPLTVSALTLLVGRQGIQPVKTECWGAAWLSVWGEVQICIWPSWCHCHSLSLAAVYPVAVNVLVAQPVMNLYVC